MSLPEIFSTIYEISVCAVEGLMYLYVVLSIPCHVALFPFYCFAYFTNSLRENNSPTAPIIVHFHRLICVMLVILLLCLFEMFYGFKIMNMLELDLFDVLYHYYFISCVIFPVFNILLTLLAVQRFFIYYSDRFGKKWILNQKNWSWIIILLYLGFFAANLGVGILETDFRFSYSNLPFLGNGSWDFGNESYLEPGYNFPFSFDSLYMTIYYYLEVIATLSAFLYVPIFISLRKKSNIASVVENQTDRLIMYQAITICVSKFVTFPFIVFNGVMIIDQGYYGFLKLACIMLSVINFATTPLLIQISYIYCNKRNVKIMQSLLTFKWFLFGIIRALKRKLRIERDYNNVVAPL
ncbi:Serpentine Receptor, class T [Caenorhabditis elegans]|uniref:Serpentine Receptor, class T n=1 Tax=Caenorhabditis elegans TaxID=6239 RepID=Q9N4T9_CAEEL|nr:Serpentine Receptor, class T [Caenorhabditis elegans]CCD64721.1 Serpentine Receptor, class T [Caenorhabditis elegans]|eukprot:NP_494565.2 Serpentine Receptor, class Z [Caenorhabditis elegans]